jgi:hypothetical protein
VIPFFAFPAEVRKVIYTTNAVESLNMSLRKVLETRGAFPSEEAALKVMYLALRNVIKKWEHPIHWKAALNRFSSRLVSLSYVFAAIIDKNPCQPGHRHPTVVSWMPRLLRTILLR